MENRHAHGNGMRGRGTPAPVVRRSYAAAPKTRNAILGNTTIQGGKIRLVPEVDAAPVTPKKPRRRGLLRPRVQHAKRSTETKQRFTSIKRLTSQLHISLWPKARRTGTIVLALYMGLVSAGTVQLLSQQLNHASYTLDSKSTKLIGKSPSDFLAKKLTYDTQQQQYLFNPNYKPDANAVSVGEGQFSATLGQNLRQKGVSITDPASQISVTLTPEFNSLPGQQQNGRVVYPLYDGSQVVYTVRSNGLKEDIVLPTYSGDTQEFTYKLDLPTGLEARVLSNGGIGIYSADPSLYGNISYGSDKDRALVQKARANGAKNNLVFGIPAPEITESSGASKATAKFVLKGNELTVQASNLKKANYPLSIDPSVVDASATSFSTGSSPPNTSSAGNLDSNIVFNASGSPTRSGVTAGIVGAWTSTGTGTLAVNQYSGAVAVSNGNIYYVSPTFTGSTGKDVYMASITASTGVVGSFSAASSLNTAAYSTSVAIANGYIYAVGGSPGNPTVTGAVQYAAICTGTNTTTAFTTNCTTSSTAGTLSSWNLNTNSLNTARAVSALYTLNNRLYAVGGATNTSSKNATATTEFATINADGSVGSWAAGSSLSTGVGYASYASNNNYLYLLGGYDSTTVYSTVSYVKINLDGTMGTWATTTAMPANLMGATAVVNANYLYVMGGETTDGGTKQTATYYVPINADGTVGVWNTTSSLGTAVQFAASFTYTSSSGSWLYSIGGCIGGSCSTASDTNIIQRSAFTAAGGANLLATGQITTAFTLESQNSTPTEGKYGHATAVLNGRLYVAGGCAAYSGDATCNTNRFTINNLTSQKLYYAPINTDGTIGSWSTDGNPIAGNGLAAFGLVAFDNSLFAIGGVSVYNFLGFTTTWQTNAYYVPINPATGATTTTWATVGNVLPQLGGTGYGYMATTYVNGYIYVAGGCNGTSGLSCSTYTTGVCRIQVTNDTIAAGANAGTPSCVPTGQANFSSVINTAGTSTLFGGSSGVTGIAQMGSAYGAGYLYMVGGATNLRSQLRSIVYAYIDPVAGITAWHVSTTGTILYSTNGGTATNDGVRDVSAAYSNGQLLAFGGYNGNGSHSRSNVISVCQVTPSTGDVASCAASTTTLSSARWGTAGTYANGYFYDTGGCTAGDADTGCSNIVATVDMYRINYGGVGAVNAWTTATNTIPTATYGTGVAAYNGYLYSAGGCTDTAGNCSTAVTTVKYTQIAGDPATSRLGTWATPGSGSALSVARGRINLIAYNGYLYAFGGTNGTTDQATYDIAPINPDGTLGAWAAGGNSMSTAVEAYGAALAGGKIFILGGSSGGTAQTAIQIGTPSATTGQLTWTTGTGFTTARSMLGATFYGGNLYIAGGYDGTNYLQDVQFASVSSTGTLGSWTYTSSLPERVRKLNLFGMNGYLMFAGGEQNGGGTCNGNAWTSSVESNGQIHFMQQNINAFTTTRGEAGGTVYDGYIYLVGGNCGTGAGTVTASTVFAGFAAQPAVSQFSQELDGGADVTPINMYLRSTRGSTSGIINVCYTSASNSSAVFGKYRCTNNMQDSTTLYSLSAIDTSSGVGAVTTLNRYYFLKFTLDDSQGFTFPEASAQETSLNNYEFFYHPNSGLRLRGGQTFNNQAATSLDAAPH